METFNFHLRFSARKHFNNGCVLLARLIKNASVQKYELHIDESKWEVTSNRLQPRRMDATRQKELFRQISLLQDAHILGAIIVDV